MRPQDVPDGVRRTTALRIADTLGLVVAASALPTARALREVALAQGGAPESTLAPGAERLPAASAALVHGSLAHSLDFDDTVPDSLLHPSCVVVPVVLAVGEASGADGTETLTAAATAYEVGARAAGPLGRRLHARGFQTTGVVGPLVAAVAAARLYGLDRTAAVGAAGLAGSMGGGLLEFLSDGSSAKRLHPGWAAHGGVLAAQLGARGFAGPRTVLEGRFGLYAAFAGGTDDEAAAVTGGLGDAWASEAGEFKLYPCAHVLHDYLDALVELAGLPAPDEIESVVCELPAWQIPIVGEPRETKIAPSTEYQARASLPFAAAAALADGAVTPASFGAEAIVRPELLALAARVELRASGRRHVSVRVAGGEVREVAVAAPVRTAAAVEDRVRTKLRANLSTVLPSPRADELLAAALAAAPPAELLALVCRRQPPC